MTTLLVLILATMDKEDVPLDTGRSVDTDTERDRFNGDDRPRCIYRYHVPVKVFECRMKNRGRKEGDPYCEGKSWFVVVVVVSLLSIQSIYCTHPEENNDIPYTQYWIILI